MQSYPDTYNTQLRLCNSDIKVCIFSKYILLQIQKQTLARLNEPLSELKRHCTWNVKYRPLFELKLYKYNSHEMKGLYGN